MAILAAGSAAVCVLPDEGIAVSLGESPINVTMGPQAINAVCDDVLTAITFTTPGFVSATFTAMDIDPGGAGATVRFKVEDCITDGTPCRARFMFLSTNDTEVSVETKNKSVDSTSQPTMSVDVDPLIADANRDCLWNILWKWTSGSESSDWALIDDGTIYAPAEGDGDVPMSLPL